MKGWRIFKKFIQCSDRFTVYTIPFRCVLREGHEGSHISLPYSPKMTLSEWLWGWYY